MVRLYKFDDNAREDDTPALCDRCRRPVWISKRVQEWTGLLVCKQCEDPVPDQIRYTPDIDPYELYVENPRPIFDDNLPKGDQLDITKWKDE